MSSVLCYKTQCHIAFSISSFSNAAFFCLLFPILFNSFLLSKVGKCNVGKEEGQIEVSLFFPFPSDNLVTASLYLTPLLAAHQILISRVTFVSRAWACLSVDIPVPSSKFPYRWPLLAPICLLLTSSVPSFPQHACPSVRPYPFSPVYSSLSNSSPNTKWHGPQMDWDLNCAS